jgi:hypothetical protein
MGNSLKKCFLVNVLFGWRILDENDGTIRKMVLVKRIECRINTAASACKRTEPEILEYFEHQASPRAMSRLK